MSFSRSAVRLRLRLAGAAAAAAGATCACDRYLIHRFAHSVQLLTAGASNDKISRIHPRAEQIGGCNKRHIFLARFAVIFQPRNERLDEEGAESLLIQQRFHHRSKHVGFHHALFTQCV